MKVWLCGLLRRTLADRKGVAAAEFALIFPLMMLLYVGGFEISQGLYAFRKVTVTARSAADLASQYMSMTENDLTNVMAASAQVMAPFAASQVTVKLSEVTTTSTSGQATVTWGRALNTSRRACGSVVAIDIPNAPAGTSLVLAEVGYTFAPFGDGTLIHPLKMADHIYMLPRQSPSITVPSC